MTPEEMKERLRNPQYREELLYKIFFDPRDAAACAERGLDEATVVVLREMYSAFHRLAPETKISSWRVWGVKLQNCLMPSKATCWCHGCHLEKNQVWQCTDFLFAGYPIPGYLRVENAFFPNTFYEDMTEPRKRVTVRYCPVCQKNRDLFGTWLRYTGVQFSC